MKYSVKILQMVDKFLDYCYYYLVEIVIKFKISILNLIIIRVVLFTDTINFYFVIQNLRRTFK